MLLSVMWSCEKVKWLIIVSENFIIFSTLTNMDFIVSVIGEVYDLLGQYYSSVCKSCLSRRPDVSLYSFIYQQVSSSPVPDDSNRGAAGQHIPTDCH